MRSSNTEYGTVIIGEQDELFEEALRILREEFENRDQDGRFSCAWTGGSTPKSLYQYAIDRNALDRAMAGQILWTVSDERCVPLSSRESNFGNADRLLLQPLQVPEDAKLPWPTELEPEAAAVEYAARWARRSKVEGERTYDLCFVGMGDDCHTLSLFPGSSLVTDDTDESFAAIEVPGKGWRLTLTPEGVKRCGRVVLMTLGAGKAKALKEVLEGESALSKKPAQLYKRVASRTTWLIDEAAASELSF